MDLSRSVEKTRDRIKGIIQQPLGVQHNADLNAAEISVLWDTYMHYSMLICVMKYFEKVTRDDKDNDTLSLITFALESFETRLKWIKDTFDREKLGVPTGFSDNDADIDAPPLYSNPFTLYYMRNMIRLGLNSNIQNINMSTRPDVRDFYSEITTTILEINKNTTDLMLERGILTRHPLTEVKDEAGFIKKPGFLAGFAGKRQPLLAKEIAHIYNIVLMNHIGRVLLAGFSQAARADRVRKYMDKGVKIAGDIIDTMTAVLKEDSIPAPLPGDAITTDSKTAPFSDKLMMFHVTTLSSFGISVYGAALGAGLRHDLTRKYALNMADAGRFAEEGIKIMMEDGWFEEPPQAVDRESLLKKLH